MYAETIARILGQLILLSGLMVGFSFSRVPTLLAERDKPRLVSAMAATFMVAASLLLYTAMVSALLLAYPLETLTPEQFARLARFYPFIQWPFRIGMFSFLAGIGLTGWTRSRWMGIASTVLTLAVFLGWILWAALLRSVFGG
jgi:hypothetical protein